jgi:hypothetical protein
MWGRSQKGDGEVRKVELGRRNAELKKGGAPERRGNLSILDLGLWNLSIVACPGLPSGLEAYGLASGS